MPETNPYRATPGRELDVQVAQIFGDSTGVSSCPAYSTDAQAADVLKARLEACYPITISVGNTELAAKPWFARSQGDSIRETEVLAETYPLAICSLALLLRNELGAPNLAPEANTAHSPNAIKLLESYRQERRRDLEAPFTLQAPARRRLQEEISRQFREPEPERRRGSLWIGLWPRLALGVTILALLVGAWAVWLAAPREQTVQLAADNRGANLESLDSAPSGPAAEIRDLGGRPTDNGESGVTSTSLGLRSAAPEKPAPTATAPAREPRSTTVQVISGRPAETEVLPDSPITPAPPSLLPDLRARGLSDAKNAPTPVAGDEQAIVERESLRRREEPALAPSGTTQPSRPIAAYFYQSNALPSLSSAITSQQQNLLFSQNEAPGRYRRNFNSPPIAPVLNSFQMQRDGANIRIIDADGSVYEGMIREESSGAHGPNAAAISNTSMPAGAAGQSSRLASASGEPQAARVLNFSASGTNRSLNQIVVFNGTMLPEPGPPLALPSAAQSFGVSGLASNNTFPPAQNAIANAASANRALLAENSSLEVSNSIALNAAANAVLPNTIPRLSEQRLRIDGRASVGGKTEVPVQAQQVQP